MSPASLARLLSLTVLALLLALIWALDRVADSSEAKAPVDMSRVDFIANQIAATRFGADGSQLLKLGSTSVRHIPQDDTMLFFDTELLISKPGAPQTTVTAKLARTVHKASEVWLNGDVDLRRAADARHDPLQVKTSEIWIDTANEIARTDAPVDVTLGKSHASAVGLVVNKAEQSVELKSKVRMTYVPKNRTRSITDLH